MSGERRFDGSEVAVVAMAGRFPGAGGVAQLWRNLRAGRDSIRRFSTAELTAAGLDPEQLTDPSYVPARGVLDDVETFDAAFFGYNPREAELMDPQQRIFLHCAWEALEGAGCDPERYEGLTGVFASVNLSGYLLSNLLPNRALLSSVSPLQLQIGNEKDYLATRVSYKLNLRGPSLTVQTACSSSLVAVHLARQSLLGEECDLALAGGVSIQLPQERGYVYEEDSILSPDGRCRPFDAAAAGTVFSNGAGVVALKRLQDALDDGDTIYALIRGSALNNDGAVKAGYTAPGLEGQSEVILEALADAGVEAGTVSYVETHGTGTALGDPIEVAALTQAFCCDTDRRGFCALGSVKSNLGHLSMASGVTSLIKTALMLRHATRVPSLHFERPNPAIDFAASPFYVQTSCEPWPNGASPRRAGVSSFGFGGTNVHMVLEEPPPPAATGASGPVQVLILSARTESALDEATESLAAHLAASPQLEAADVAYTLQVGRQAFSCRRMAVCRDREEMLAALASPRHSLASLDQERRDRPVVFLFPGQGAQRAAMGAELYRREPRFRETADRCAEILLPHLGSDLRPLLFTGEVDAEEAAARLEETSMAQPALFLLEYALARWWMDLGVRPQAMLGHSLGEYVAACLAGVFTLEDALGLVAERGRLMQSMPAGAMLAVPLGEDDLQPYLSDGLSLAAVNAPQRTVVSGPPARIAELAERLGARQVEARRLRTSHAYHSPMMEPVATRLAAAIDRLERRPPEIPVISSRSGEPLTAEAAVDPGYWAGQLLQPVRFARGVAELGKEPGRILLEVGPGETLSRLTRAQVASKTAVLPSLPPSRDAGHGELASLYHAAGRLWLAGATLDWARIHPGRRRRVDLPTYPFARQRFWIDPPDPRAERPPRATGSQPLSGGFATRVWRQTPPLPRARLGDARRWLLCHDSGGLLGQALGQRLQAAGHDVVWVEPGSGFEDLGNGRFTVHPAEPDHLRALTAALGERGWKPDHVVHLWSAAPPAEGTSLQAELDRGFFSLLHLARALLDKALQPRITVVSDGTRVVTGEEELVPGRAATLGLCHVISQEHPELACRNVDMRLPVGRETQGVEPLLAELTAETAEREVAWRGARRWIPGFEALRLEADETTPPRLRPGGTYLAVGGVTGLGRLLLDHLAGSLQPRLVLVEEAPVPGDERAAALKALAETGAEICSVEPADPPAFEEALRRVERKWGRIEGAFYAPELAAADLTGPFDTIEPAACARFFATRARGLELLERALAERDAGFCLVHSSLASILGGPGLAAHAAASHLLDAWVERNDRLSQVHRTTINWDAWQLTDSDRPSANALTPAQGVEAFRRVCAAETLTQVSVSSADLAERLERWARGGAPPRPAGSRDPRSRHERPADLGAPYVAPGNEIEGRLAEIWQELLGIDRVGVEDDFFELGGDSLLGTQVISRVREVFAVSLSLRGLFESPTVAGMAAKVSREQATSLGADDLAEILAEIEEL